jgi:hypothetical protein
LKDSLLKTSRDGAAGTNLFNRGEHGVENMIAFLKLILIVIIIVVRVQGQVRKIIIIGRIVPIVSVSLL